jgi:hypothetical protein
VADRPKVLVAEEIADSGVDLLREVCDVDVDLGLDADQLKAKIGDYDAILIRSATTLDESAIEAATKKEVDRRDITVPEIHRTGSYKVQVKLHPEVIAEINLEVTSH